MSATAASITVPIATALDIVSVPLEVRMPVFWLLFVY
jgi:hypothetical protein